MPPCSLCFERGLLVASQLINYCVLFYRFIVFNSMQPLFGKKAVLTLKAVTSVDDLYLGTSNGLKEHRFR